MTKIILVRGPHNTGKTTSIRRFLENRGIFFTEHPRDIAVVLPLKKGSRTYRVGIATSGDAARDIEEHFRFFAPHRCEIIVCASRSIGQTYAAIERAASELRARVIPITTTRVAGTRVRAENDRVVAEIEDNIR